MVYEFLTHDGVVYESVYTPSIKEFQNNDITLIENTRILNVSKPNLGLIDITYGTKNLNKVNSEKFVEIADIVMNTREIRPISNTYIVAVELGVSSLLTPSECSTYTFTSKCEHGFTSMINDEMTEDMSFTTKLLSYVKANIQVDSHYIMQYTRQLLKLKRNEPMTVHINRVSIYRWANANIQYSSNLTDSIVFDNAILVKELSSEELTWFNVDISNVKTFSINIAAPIDTSLFTQSASEIHGFLVNEPEPEDPSEGGETDPETPAEGGETDPETPAEGGETDPETPAEGGETDPETPAEGGETDPETNEENKENNDNKENL